MSLLEKGKREKVALVFAQALITNTSFIIHHKHQSTHAAFTDIHCQNKHTVHTIQLLCYLIRIAANM